MNKGLNFFFELNAEALVRHFSGANLKPCFKQAKPCMFLLNWLRSTKILQHIKKLVESL